MRVLLQQYFNHFQPGAAYVAQAEHGAALRAQAFQPGKGRFPERLGVYAGVAGKVARHARGVFANHAQVRALRGQLALGLAGQREQLLRPPAQQQPGVRERYAPRPRSKRRAPSSSSSCESWRLSVGWVMCRASAARVMFSSCATVRK